MPRELAWHRLRRGRANCPAAGPQRGAGEAQHRRGLSVSVIALSRRRIAGIGLGGGGERRARRWPTLWLSPRLRRPFSDQGQRRWVCRRCCEWHRWRPRPDSGLKVLVGAGELLVLAVRPNQGARIVCAQVHPAEVAHPLCGAATAAYNLSPSGSALRMTFRSGKRAVPPQLKVFVALATAEVIVSHRPTSERNPPQPGRAARARRGP